MKERNEFISKEFVLKILKESEPNWEKFSKEIGLLPIIKIVRCKDCQFRADPDECPMCEWQGYEDGWIDWTDSNGFCYKGEDYRKGEKECHL